MRALTIKRPWATAIAQGVKTVENRSWCPSKRFLGARIAIHAGFAYDREGARWLRRTGLWDPPSPSLCPTGIVAVATLAEVVTESDDPWFVGRYGWVLADVVALERPIPISGRLRLWRLPLAVSGRLRGL